MRRLSIVLVGGLLCVPTATFSDPASDDQVPLSDQQIKTVVKKCVHEVHEKTQLGAFDAFWNSASGKIENTARMMTPYNGPRALFLFNKCMAEEGVPLKYDK